MGELSTAGEAGASAETLHSEPVKSGMAGIAASRFGRFLESYALLILLLLTAVFFSVLPATSGTFLTVSNIKLLVASQAVIGLIAIGALIPLISMEFDLSVGAIAGISAVVVAELVSGSTPLVLGILVGVGIGILAGALNGLIVTRAKVNGVITTLGTSTVLTGVVLQITGGLAAPSDIPRALTNFGTNTVFGVPLMFIALMIMASVVYFLLSHTSFGRQLYALGSNADAAVLVGLRVRVLRGAAFAVGGTICGIAGVLYVARAGGADPNLGPVFTLPALAAAFLSAAAVKPGRFNVWGTVVAIYFLAVLNNGINLTGAEPYFTHYVNGAALIIGVALAAYLQRRRAS